MKIIFEKHKVIPYEKLKPGDLFMHDGTVFMRTDESELLDNSGKIPSYAYKSVNLSEGTMEVFDHHTAVVLLNEGKLYLNYFEEEWS